MNSIKHTESDSSGAMERSFSGIAMDGTECLSSDVLTDSISLGEVGTSSSGICPFEDDDRDSATPSVLLKAVCSLDGDSTLLDSFASSVAEELV